ncbi:MAG TPA: cupin domain-containing protein [Syntrophomonadaceae bacterium]|nr:cupin domain-containing protein [Syntrophomonadaceae bacterium]
MNLFDLPDRIGAEEYFQPLIPDHGVLIERIISTGQSSPPGVWYDQERDELVAVLQGEALLEWETGHTQTLMPGDWVLIAAREKHRVAWTSTEPPCIWLAIHGSLL